MPALPDAVWPFRPFPNPVALPSGLPTDGDTFCIRINAEWLSYVIPCCFALLHDSTWDSNDPSTVQDVEARAWTLIRQLIEPEACPVPPIYRVNPTYTQNWQYSNDVGVTWLDGPDCASNFTPDFIVDGAAPGGYDLTVNGDHSATAIPTLTATDPDAVITNPSSTFRNLITADVGGAEGIAIQALANIGVQLVQANGIAAEFNKIPGLGLATNALEILGGGSDYTYDLLAALF